ncbi:MULTISPECIES: LysE/ArgO family amino acid transporter [Paenibacillus]|uniref:LysE family transporter n=1 Tax=Paenibacillus alvei TaxID=44250 RepID=A0ABT4E838_PAEAL|nr:MULTISPECIES: LysE family transporter [Paenibacillus]EPY13140.1 lyse/ygga family protein [Paenibacillus alvei A6-6i-x]MCY9529899.1 LysE family transporter [Paenibacillus alvei]SDE77685.1 L-lysine exporter family protein LysE/ArgO [Paenibacillus sp. cl6col]
MVEAFVHGILLALGLILPLGAQNVFIFNQGALSKPFVKAIPVVITAALCDTLLILAAVQGISLFIWKWKWLQYGLYLLGFFFLLFMGWSLWKSSSKLNGSQGSAMSIPKQMMFAMSVSLLNPHAILDTIGVIGTNSLQYSDKLKWMFTIACIAVSWLWFLGLAVAGHFTNKIDADGRILTWLNKISAITIWLIAVYMLVQLLTGGLTVIG